MKEPSTFDLIFATSALLVHVEKLSDAILGLPVNQEQSHKHYTQALEAQTLASGIRASWPDTFRKPSEPLVPVTAMRAVPDCPHFCGVWFGQHRAGGPLWTYAEASRPSSSRCTHPKNSVQDPATKSGVCALMLCPLGRKDPEAQ